MVSQLIKSAHDDFERVSPVMTFQIFDVFEHEKTRAFGRQYADYVEKKGALRLTSKSVLCPQRVLFGYTSYGKRLTRNACQQHIMVRDDIIYMGICLLIGNGRVLAQGYIPDILVETVVVIITGKIGLVGTNGKLIPLTTEYT